MYVRRIQYNDPSGMGDLGKFRIGKVFKKIAKKLNPVRILKKSIKSGRKRLKNPKLILKDIRRQALRASTFGASDLYEKNVKRRRKKYRTETSETATRMKKRGIPKADIDKYVLERSKKLTHRRKKMQRGVRAVAITAAVVAGAVAFGPGMLASMGSGGATAGAGAAGTAAAGTTATAATGWTAAAIGGAKMVGGSLLPMVIQKAVGGGGGQPEGPGGPGYPGQYPGTPGYTGGPAYTGPGAGVVGSYQQTMQQAGIPPIVPIALIAGIILFKVIF